MWKKFKNLNRNRRKLNSGYPWCWRKLRGKKDSLVSLDVNGCFKPQCRACKSGLPEYHEESRSGSMLCTGYVRSRRPSSLRTSTMRQPNNLIPITWRRTDTQTTSSTRVRQLSRKILSTKYLRRFLYTKVSNPTQTSNQKNGHHRNKWHGKYETVANKNWVLSL